MRLSLSILFISIYVSANALALESTHAKHSTTYLGLTQENFIYPDQKQIEQGSHQVVSLSHQISFKNQDLSGYLDSKAAIATKNTDTYKYLQVSQAYLSVEHLSFGRKIQDWSLMDSEWQLGLWQPRFRWNQMNPEPQGLTGVFADLQNDQIKFYSIWSMINLPDQNAGFSNLNGELYSANPFFHSPKTSATVFGKNTSVHYNLVQPNISKIVFQPSVASSISLKESKNLESKISYANKPMPQFFVGVEQFLDLHGVANANLNPFTNRHQLFTLEQEIKNDTNSLWISGTHEIVQEKDHDALWTLQRAEGANYLSAGAGTKFSNSIFIDAKLSASYFKRLKGDVLDSGDFANSKDTMFENRFLGHEAIQLKLKNRFSGRIGNRISVGHKWVYELINQSAVYGLNTSYEITNNFQVGLGGELISARPQVADSGNSSDLFSRNRTNDRIYAGVSYVF